MHYTRKAACCCCLVNLTLLLLLDFKPSEAFAPAASRHSRRPPTMSPASTAVQLAAKTKPGHDDDDFSCEIHFEEERDGVEAVLVVTDGCSEQKPSAVEKSNVPGERFPPRSELDHVSRMSFSTHILYILYVLSI